MLKLMSLVLIVLPGVAVASGGEPVTWATPEPTTVLLLVSGLLGLWGARKKFKR